MALAHNKESSLVFLEEVSVETVSAQHPNTIRCQCVVPLQRDHVLIRMLGEDVSSSVSSCPPDVLRVPGLVAD